MKKNSKIFVAGHLGLVGSAITKKLIEKGFNNLLLRSKKELDLLNQKMVSSFFSNEKPEYVILAAAKVGGIDANNNYRADFIYENIQIQNNVIYYSYLHNVKKLLFLGSTCIYPMESVQPIKEEYLLNSLLEYTNEPYAIAKIAGIKLCESYNLQYGCNFISVMPTNLYGPNDNFNLKNSHVLPALFRKIFLAKNLEDNNWDLIRKDLIKRPLTDDKFVFNKNNIITLLDSIGIKIKDSNNENYNVEVEIWGSGKPFREFLWSEEMANACVFIMQNIDFKDIVKHNHLNTPDFDVNKITNCHLNIGSGEEITINNLSQLIKDNFKFKGSFTFNRKKPDGTFRKLTDTSKLDSLGWTNELKLSSGIKKISDWYINNLHN